MDKVTISLTALLKAQQKFELFSANLQTEQDKAGAIQAFEFCFELAWRTLKKVLEKQQTDKLLGPRDTIRMGAHYRFINNPELWFEFLDCRNLTSHTYEEDVADEVIEMFPLFSSELALLINQLKKSSL